MIKKDKMIDRKRSTNHWWKQIREAYRMLKDPRTPRIQKYLLVGVILYIFSPWDLLPDFIPFTGYLDDIGLFLLALRQITIWTEKWRVQKMVRQRKYKHKSNE